MYDEGVDMILFSWSEISNRVLAFVDEVKSGVGWGLFGTWESLDPRTYK